MTYLLTGGSGFLGSLLSVTLIKKGHKVIFLGRAKDNQPLKQRIEQILKSIEPNIFLENTESIEVDLSRDNLQLNISQSIGKIDAIWHLAADLSFKEKDRDKVFAVNVNGLKNILDLAEKIKCPIYYTSTAYVHGQRQGLIFEHDLIKPNCFNSVYEESKFEAERIIRKWGDKKENKFIIFRPSILINREEKRASFFGYYAIVYSLYKLSQKFGRRPIKIFVPFPCSKNAFLNLMPIDIAVDWLIKIASAPNALGRTFHITNPLPFSMKEISEQTFKANNIKIPCFNSPKWFVYLYFSLFSFLGFFIKPIKKLAKKFFYYRYYMIEYNMYDMRNTKEVLGKDIVNQFHFEKDFIEKIAKRFIKKLESKKQ